MGRRAGRLAVVSTRWALAFGLVAGALAAPGSADDAPANDDVDGATVVSAIPFADRVDTTHATRAADDPAVSGWDCLGGVGHTVWYRFTAPRSRTYALDTRASSYDTTVAVYTGERGSLALVDCSGYFRGELRGRLLLATRAGTTYHVMVGATEPSGAGELRFTIERSAVAPLEVELAVEPRAHLAPNREVVLAGTVRCSRRAQVGLDGALSQGETTAYFFPEPFACGPEPVGFRAATREANGAFRIGPAEALVVAYGEDAHDRDTPDARLAVEVVPGRIVFARSATATGDPAATEIYAMEADGSGVVRLTRNAVEDTFPAVSPDGTLVAFSRLVEGQYDLFVKALSGGGLRRVTRTPGLDEALPAWSPDGAVLVATVTLRNPAGWQSDLVRVSAAGGPVERLTRTGRASEFAPEWSPDGALIAFTRWNPVRERFGIAALDPSGGAVRWLAVNPLSTSGYTDANPTWSPDGLWVAFAREHGTDPFVDVYAVRRDGSGLVPVTQLSGLSENPAWGPDGRIAFQHEGGIALVRSDGSGLVHVTPLHSGAPYDWPDW